MKAIILAAGRGSRLYPYTKYIPKCLLDIGGESILEHQMNHIRDCGIDEVVIVVGFGFEKVENFLRDYDGLGMRITTLYNPFYQTTNSLISLWIAKCEMNQDIVIINGDDVFEIDVLEKVLGIRVFRDIGVDLIKRAIEEEMRTVGAEKKWYASAIQRLVTKGYRIKSLDIEELFWMDVDYPSDLFRARFNSGKFIKKSQKERILRVVDTTP